jgi:hypothetical protein
LQLRILFELEGEGRFGAIRREANSIRTPSPIKAKVIPVVTIRCRTKVPSILFIPRSGYERTKPGHLRFNDANLRSVPSVANALHYCIARAPFGLVFKFVVSAVFLAAHGGKTAAFIFGEEHISLCGKLIEHRRVYARPVFDQLIVVQPCLPRDICSPV